MSPKAYALAVLAALALLTIALVQSVRAETGIGSVYWEGRYVASGARFYPDAVSCAHKTLPLGTTVRVTDLGTGRSISCVINDRGPFVRGRIVDLSRGAARALGMDGLARVRVEVVR